MTDRQKMIIRLLQKNDLTSEKMAEFLHVSSRTVMRDIAELNDSLQRDGIGIIESNYHGLGYQLIIHNEQKFNHYLDLKKIYRLVCF